MTDKKSIVIYFSRADENYGVGYTDKGNTQYLAEFIADATGADMFKVEPAVPYAKDYDTAVEEAKRIFAKTSFSFNTKLLWKSFVDFRK